MNSSEYQVTIKSANQKVDDYMTKCRPGWTVRQLKQHISETHVNRPKVEDQRLIYAGNLLKDTHTLKQIFFRDSLCTELTNASKTDFTIHLVCYSYTHRLPGNPGTGQTLTAGQSSSTTSASSAPATNSTQTGFIRPRPNAAITNRSPVINQQAPVTRSTPTSNQSTLPATSSTALNATQQAEMIRNFMQSDQMRQQMVVFQQLAHMVAAQIATNLAYSNNNNIINPNQRNSTTNETLSSHAHIPVIGVQLTNSPITSAASQLLYAENRQRAQFVQSSTHEHRAGPVNQNENINNENNANVPAVAEPAGPQFGFGGQLQGQAPVVEQPAPQPEADAPMIQHDVIDWVYYSIRAAGLMAALYIHASMFRLLFIVGLLAIAYFFNRRRVLPAARHDLGQPQRAQEFHPFVNRRADDAELRRRNVDQGEQPNVGDSVNNNEEAPARDRAQEEVGPGRLPFLKLCYLVVTEFLASLVPE